MINAMTTLTLILFYKSGYSAGSALPVGKIIWSQKTNDLRRLTQLNEITKNKCKNVYRNYNSQHWVQS